MLAGPAIGPHQDHSGVKRLAAVETAEPQIFRLPRGSALEHLQVAPAARHLTLCLAANAANELPAELENLPEERALKSCVRDDDRRATSREDPVQRLQETMMHAIVSQSPLRM